MNGQPWLGLHGIRPGISGGFAAGGLRGPFGYPGFGHHTAVGLGQVTFVRTGTL